MSIFERQKHKRPPSGGGNGDLNLDLEEIRERVPDADAAMDDIERALADTTPEALARPATRRETLGGCGCWG